MGTWFVDLTGCQLSAGPCKTGKLHTPTALASGTFEQIHNFSLLVGRNCILAKTEATHSQYYCLVL